MKKLSLLALIAITATACNSPSYTITGTMANMSMDGKKAYLHDAKAPQGVYIDSTIITGNKFEFKGSVPDSLNTFFNIIIPQINNSAIVIPENNEISVQYFVNSTPMPNSKGVNGVYNAFLTEKQNIELQARAIIESLKIEYEENQQAFISEFNRLITPLSKQNDAITQKYMLENKNNRLGTYLLCDLLFEAQTLKQFDSLAAIIPAASEFQQIKNIRQQLESIEKTNPGKMFSDFNAKNPDGSQAKLSDYVGKGKYVLVDFWASWCAPCKQEVPYLKFLHSNYKDLIVLGINVWDKMPDFKKTVTNEGMTWAQLYASDNQDATNTYNIESIPAIILFAPDGTIVDKTLRGDALIYKFAEIFPDVKTRDNTL